MRKYSLHSRKVISALSPEIVSERGMWGCAASWKSKDSENTLPTHDMATLTQELERNTSTMITKKESRQTHPFGIEGQAERGKDIALLHEQGGSDVHPHSLSTVSPAGVHSQSQSCLRSPPS